MNLKTIDRAVFDASDNTNFDSAHVTLTTVHCMPVVINQCHFSNCKIYIAKLWQKRYVLYPRLVQEKMRRHDMHSRHVFAHEFIYYRATVIFENRFVVPSAFGRQYIACLS